jgi:FecR protein
MKNLHLILRTFAPVLLLTVLVSAGYPQTREKFGISAKAGGVNAVAGSVMVTRTGQTPQLLTDQDDLVSGNVVTTGQMSQAEVLLNPGSYLRLAANSELVLVDDSLNHLVVKLVKGSAIIEASGGDYSDVRINVLANQQSLIIIRGGIYRFNVQGSSTEVLVRKGRVIPGSLFKEVIKGGTKVTYTAGGPVLAKLNKKDQDDFDFWSKKRADTLAQANRRISGRTVNGYLSNMTILDWASAGYAGGLWSYSPFSRCYTFLPFRYGWSSPYGHYYDNYYYYSPYRGYPNNGVVVGNPTSGGSNGWPGGNGSPTSGGPGPGSPSGPSSAGPSAPSTPMGSQAGPRDPDSGSRSINRIKDPNN